MRLIPNFPLAPATATAMGSAFSDPDVQDFSVPFRRIHLVFFRLISIGKNNFRFVFALQPTTFHTVSAVCEVSVITTSGFPQQNLLVRWHFAKALR